MGAQRGGATEHRDAHTYTQAPAAAAGVTGTHTCTKNRTPAGRDSGTCYTKVSGVISELSRYIGSYREFGYGPAPVPTVSPRRDATQHQQGAAPVTDYSSRNNKHAIRGAIKCLVHHVYWPRRGSVPSPARTGRPLPTIFIYFAGRASPRATSRLRPLPRNTRTPANYGGHDHPCQW